MFEDENTIGSERGVQRRAREKFRCEIAFTGLLCIRRIGENQVKRCGAREAIKIAEDVDGMDSSGQMRGAQIAFYRIRRGVLLLDKFRRGSATTEGFDAERSAARKEIEHSRTDDEFPETRKDRAFHAIHCRSDVTARGAQ